MQFWFRHQGAVLARALLALALIAMLVRAVVPAGYMLAAGGQDGRFLTVTFCSGHGATEKVLDLKTGALVDKKSGSDGEQQRADAPCAFAVASILSAPHEATLVLTPVAVVSIALPALRDLRPGLGLVAPPPPATGPPATIV